MSTTGGIPPAQRRSTFAARTPPGGGIRQRSAAVHLQARSPPPIPPALKRAIDMTDDELAAIASGATLHVVK